MTLITAQWQAARKVIDPSKLATSNNYWHNDINISREKQERKKK